MRVGINAYLLSNPSLRGWNRYTLNLVRALADLGLELMLYLNRPMHPAHQEALKGVAGIVVAPPMRYAIWEQRWLPRQCRNGSVDLLHSTFNYGLPVMCPCPRVLTLHDAIDSAMAGQRSLFESIKPSSLLSQLRHHTSRRVADRLITVSEYSRRDIVARLGVDGSRLDVVYGAADPRFTEPISQEHRDQVRQRYGLDRPFVFYVGGWEERKNVPFLVRAFADAGLRDHDLLLAGGSEAQQQTIADLAASRGIDRQVKMLGWVDDRDLPALYASALCFVYPSMYEGFGLQLCEAMATGCPIFAADAASLPEVLGDGGELFPLSSTDGLAKQLRHIAADDSFRESLQSRARNRSSQFCWNRAAEETREIYRRAIAAHSVSSQ